MIKIIIVFLCASLLVACATTYPDNCNAATYDVQLGLSYLDMGDVAHAYHKFQRAVKEAPHASVSLNAMAYYYEQLHETKLADEWYQRAIHIAPSGQIYNNYGVFLCQQGDYQKALKQFKLALKDHDYVAYKIYVNAGMCALANDDKQTAIPMLKQALTYQPHAHEIRAALNEIEK